VNLLTYILKSILNTPADTGKHQRTLETNSGHWKTPADTGNQQRTLETNSGHWKTPAKILQKVNKKTVKPD